MWTLIFTTAAADPPAPVRPPEEEEELDLARGSASNSAEGNKDEWGFDVGSDIAIDADEDDPDMLDFVAARLKQPPEPTHLHLYPKSQLPLSDDWALYIASYNDTFVVAELPVLVARDRASFAAAHPGGLELVGVWTSGPHSLTISQTITADQVLPGHPTFSFLRAAMPNAAPIGDMRVLVKTRELPLPPVEGEEPPAAAPLKDRYARTTVYTRK